MPKQSTKTEKPKNEDIEPAQTDASHSEVELEDGPVRLAAKYRFKGLLLESDDEIKQILGTGVEYYNIAHDEDNKLTTLTVMLPGNELPGEPFMHYYLSSHLGETEDWTKSPLAPQEDEDEDEDEEKEDIGGAVVEPAPATIIASFAFNGMMQTDDPRILAFIHAGAEAEAMIYNPDTNITAVTFSLPHGIVVQMDEAPNGEAPNGEAPNGEVTEDNVPRETSGAEDSTGQ